jgi:hypothetical protein
LDASPRLASYSWHVNDSMMDSRIVKANMNSVAKADLTALEARALSKKG